MLSRLLAGAALLNNYIAEAGPKKEDTPPRTELSHPCSRSISRMVRKQLEKEVLQPATREGHISWPDHCPWDPKRDLYGHHEKQKQRKRPGNPGASWTCGICGKSFISEHYLDLHLERKHMNEAPADGVCIADYCEVFDVCQGDSRKRHLNRQKEQCSPENLTIARKICEDGMLTCFPLEQEVPRKLHAQMSRHWCQVLDCRIREERRREEESSLVPVAVLLVLIILFCFIIFGLVVCCVDYSDDIVQFLQESGILSNSAAKKIVQTRESARRTMGVDRTKNI